MAHGIYKIVVKKQDETDFEYYGESHPNKGDLLKLPTFDGNLWEVTSVQHVMKNNMDGGQFSHRSLDYVQLDVVVIK